MREKKDSAANMNCLDSMSINPGSASWPARWDVYHTLVSACSIWERLKPPAMKQGNHDKGQMCLLNTTKRLLSEGRQPSKVTDITGRHQSHPTSRGPGVFIVVNRQIGPITTEAVSQLVGPRPSMAVWALLKKVTACLGVANHRSGQ